MADAGQRYRRKTGFSETILANRIAFGKIYQNSLRADVESMGYKTVDAGRNGMWEMEGVPVESFSTRSQELREAAGPDASLKSRDVAALDTRKSKEAIDPAEKMVEWMNTLKETGFDIRGTVRPPMREPQSWPVHLPRR